jgi:hypothetical protein
MTGPGARSPGIPGSSTDILIYVGPGNPYARLPGKSTKIHIHERPGGPHAKDPGRSTKIHMCVEPGGPYARDPGGSTVMWGIGARTPGTPGSTNTHLHVGPEVNKYTHLCGAREPVRQRPCEVDRCTHLCETRGPLRQGPRGSTNIHLYVGPGGPYASTPGAGPAKKDMGRTSRRPFRGRASQRGCGLNFDTPCSGLGRPRRMWVELRRGLFGAEPINEDVG